MKFVARCNKETTETPKEGGPSDVEKYTCGQWPWRGLGGQDQTLAGLTLAARPLAARPPLFLPRFVAPSRTRPSSAAHRRKRKRQRGHYP